MVRKRPGSSAGEGAWSASIRGSVLRRVMRAGWRSTSRSAVSRIALGTAGKGCGDRSPASIPRRCASGRDPRRCTPACASLRARKYTDRCARSALARADRADPPQALGLATRVPAFRALTPTSKAARRPSKRRMLRAAIPACGIRGARLSKFARRGHASSPHERTTRNPATGANAGRRRTESMFTGSDLCVLSRQVETTSTTPATWLRRTSSSIQRRSPVSARTRSSSSAFTWAM